ncbi:MAG: hypothetical protein JNJ46_15790 [Myxococcales bacterium]|nr:hypothetical protein [Myxococcales bacterium]
MSSRPTSNEEKRFFEEYRSLSTLLALFADPDDGQTDAEITQQAVLEYDPSWIVKVLADAQRFLGQHELPLRLIATNANRYLVTEAEQRQWLQTLLDRVQTELDAREAGANVKHI